jgi:hypothetical protein
VSSTSAQVRHKASQGLAGFGFVIDPWLMGSLSERRARRSTWVVQVGARGQGASKKKKKKDPQSRSVALRGIAIFWPVL